MNEFDINIYNVQAHAHQVVTSIQLHNQELKKCKLLPSSSDFDYIIPRTYEMSTYPTVFLQPTFLSTSSGECHLNTFYPVSKVPDVHDDISETNGLISKFNRNNLNEEQFSCSDLETINNQLISSVNVFNKRKRGRPKVKSSILATHSDLSGNINQESYPYHPDHVWCPMCQKSYASFTCSIHTFFDQPDNITLSLARRSLPDCLQLIPKAGHTRVFTRKRLAAPTRFGPLIAPTINEFDVKFTDDILKEYPFRLDLIYEDNSKHSVIYPVLNDEELCNWMIFVRRTNQSYMCENKNNRYPNCIAYQQGNTGIYFLTTRFISPNEELVVAYAPPYASQCNVENKLVQLNCESDRSPKASTLVANKNKLSKPNLTLTDEIHCYLCSLTFSSEDAFRIHCLGHPMELVDRGIDILSTELNSANGNQTLPMLDYIDSNNANQCKKLSNDLEINQPQLKSILFHSKIQCSLCFEEFTNLSKLIKHTNSIHCLTKPVIFNPSKLSELGSFNDETRSCDLWKSTVNSTNLGSNYYVIDLNRPKLFVFGCGLCKEICTNAITLNEHKALMHENSRLNKSSSREISGLDKTFDSVHDDIPNVSSNGINPVSQDIELTHTKNPEFDCLQCGAQFSSRSCLGVHMRSHNQQSSQILNLNSADLQQDSTKVPLLLCSNNGRISNRPKCQVVHSSRKLIDGFFQCKVCNTHLKSQIAWREHGFKHQRQLDGLYPCALCSNSSKRIYQSFDQLHRHMRQVHTNQIFPCPYCTRTFGRRINLQNHLVKHTGCRDFPCTYPNCQRVYSRVDRLRKHLRTHVSSKFWNV